MRSDGKRVTREASRATGTFLFFPRAHLLTTSSEQTPYHSLCLLGRAHSFRCSSSPQKVLRLSGTPFGGGISYRNRALISALRAAFGGCAPKRACGRSPRGMRLLRQPDGQCHISADLLSLSTQLVEYCRFNRRYSTNCPHKPATGSFICGYDPKFSLGSFLFHKEKQKLYERIGTNKWRSIIWKPRSSAGAQGDPPWLLQPI